MVNGYVKGDIPDYQMAAFLMAIYFKHMDGEERAILTETMANSGDKVDLSSIPGIKIDKTFNRWCWRQDNTCRWSNCCIVGCTSGKDVR